MNLAEARAICDGNKNVSFCTEEGYTHLAWIGIDGDGEWYNAAQVLMRSEFASSPSRKLTYEAVYLVLMDKIAQHASGALREAQAL